MTSVERHEMDTGSAWAWNTYVGTDHTRIRHQLQFVTEREMWVRWEKVEDGGWVSRPAPELPVPEDDEQANAIVRALVVEEKRAAR